MKRSKSLRSSWNYFALPPRPRARRNSNASSQMARMSPRLPKVSASSMVSSRHGYLEGRNAANCGKNLSCFGFGRGLVSLPRQALSCILHTTPGDTSLFETGSLTKCDWSMSETE